jgi:hypothetical protein
MVSIGGENWPYQWRAVLDNGLAVFPQDGGQSVARALPRPIRKMEVFGQNRITPFEIEFPEGAKPVIFRRFSLGAGAYRKDQHPRYFYGWELQRNGTKEMSLWEFRVGDPIPTHHDRK